MFLPLPSNWLVLPLPSNWLASSESSSACVLLYFGVLKLSQSWCETLSKLAIHSPEDNL